MPWVVRRMKCAPRCCACWATRRRRAPAATIRGYVLSATAMHPIQIYPTGRDRHDRASHACPRLLERGSIDRRAPARDVEGDSPDRACVGADIGIDRAGGVVAQSTDF